MRGPSPRGLLPRFYGERQGEIGGERGIRTLGRVSPTHAFQACSIDHSDISPFRINNLRSLVEQHGLYCDKSSNVPRSLSGVSSIAAALMLARRNDRGASMRN